MTSRIIGSVAVVMLMVGMGAAALLVRSDDGTEPTEENPEFVLAEDICERVDFSPVFAVYPFTPADLLEREETGSIDQAVCTFDRSTPLSAIDAGPLGLMVANVAVYDTAEAARSGFDHLRASRTGFRDGPDEMAGRWEETAIVSERTAYGSEVELMVLDGVLLLNLRFAISTWDEPPELDIQQAALAEVADSVRGLARR